MKARALVIAKNFPPAVGGIERIAFNLVTALSYDFQCDLVAPAGSRQYTGPGVMVHEIAATTLASFLRRALITSKHLSSIRDYAICVAQSGVVAPIAIAVGRRSRIAVVTFVHGLDVVAESELYQYQRLFVGAIRCSDLVIANSGFTASIAQCKGVPVTRITVLNPGADCPSEARNKCDFAAHYGIVRRRMLLFVGRLIKRKGIKEFLQNCFPMILREDRHLIFVVIGEEPERTKQDVIKSTIETAVRELGLEKNVLMLGRVDDIMLAAAYDAADVFVFPIVEVKQDTEGFGIVVLEAASCGVPTVAFNMGGVSEAISEGVSGTLVAPGDYEQFTREVIRFLESTRCGTFDVKACEAFASSHSWCGYQSRVRELLGVNGLLRTYAPQVSDEK